MFVILLGSLLPSLMLVYWIYTADRFREPLSSMAGAMFLGVISPLITLKITSYLLLSSSLLGIDVTDGTHPWLYSLLAAAIPEELGRLIILSWVCFKWSSVREPFDCLVYAAAIWAGFAVTENVLYALDEHQKGGDPIIILSVRASLCTMGHTAWGVIMGAYMGIARWVREDERKKWLLKGLGITVTLHMLYDGLLFSLPQGGGVWKVIGAFAIDALSLVLALVFLVRMHVIQSVSQYEGDQLDVQRSLFQRHTPDSAEGLYELITHMHIKGLLQVAFAMSFSSIGFALLLQWVVEPSLQLLFWALLVLLLGLDRWRHILEVAREINNETNQALNEALKEHPHVRSTAYEGDDLL